MLRHECRVLGLDIEVREGDTIEGLAAEVGLPPQALLAANKGALSASPSASASTCNPNILQIPTTPRKIFCMRTFALLTAMLMCALAVPLSRQE